VDTDEAVSVRNQCIWHDEDGNAELASRTIDPSISAVALEVGPNQQGIRLIMSNFDGQDN
jgi:hypothetical protein